MSMVGNVSEAEYLADMNIELRSVGLKPVASLEEARRTARPAVVESGFASAARNLSGQESYRAAQVRIDLASEAQVRYLNNLAQWIAEANGIEIPDLSDEFAKLTKREASEQIDKLRATLEKARQEREREQQQARAEAKKVQAPAVTDGMYLMDGRVFKVQIAKQGSGNLYAKELIEGSFVYSPGMIRQLRPEHRMSLEQAKEYGKLYGVCCNCGRDLTDEGSIEAGIGPVCAKKF